MFCKASVMTVALCMVGAISGTMCTGGATLNPQPLTLNPKPCAWRVRSQGLWAHVAVVPKWEAVGVEWYHHKLMNGVTHVDVNAHTIVDVQDRGKVAGSIFTMSLQITYKGYAL